MKALFRFLLVVTTATTVLAADTDVPRLWYSAPAQKWTDALPIGNGRLGAMVFGDITDERIQFNESTLWNGKPHDYARPTAPQHLAELRQLIFDGKDDAAKALATKEFLCTPQLPGGLPRQNARIGLVGYPLTPALTLADRFVDDVARRRRTAGHLQAIGLGSHAFFSDEQFALPTIAAINVWRYTGYTALLFYTGLQSIPEHLYEAARIETLPCRTRRQHHHQYLDRHSAAWRLGRVVRIRDTEADCSAEPYY